MHRRTYRIAVFLIIFAGFFVTAIAQKTEQNAAQADQKKESVPVNAAQAQGVAQNATAAAVNEPSQVKEAPAQTADVQVVQITGKTSAPAETPSVEEAVPSSNVTLDFKEADIRNVIKIIALKAGVNIVPTSEVIGNVTIRLVDVPWEKALDVLLKTYGFAYERKGNIITVAPIEKLTSLKKQEVELSQVQPVITEVFMLKYIDAQDAKKALDAQLSPRGKITVLEMTGQAGWEFAKVKKGETEDTKLQRKNTDFVGRSKILIVTDIQPALDRIKEVVAQIDLAPQQILIEARIMEVNREKLLDIGVEWGTGTDGVTATTPSDVAIGGTQTTIAGRSISAAGGFTPGAFSPTEGTTVFPGTYPYAAGLEMLLKKVGGTEMEAIVHALDEDTDTNTLSAPRIMALNNQEATILVGTKYPILATTTTGAGSTAVSTVSLDYYQDIGIQLNVVPQIGANNSINMVIHPAISAYSTTLGTNAYPIMEIREAETRVMMKDGETIVIGGLLKDYYNKEDLGIPFLQKIPLLGQLFGRKTSKKTKIDLLIFLSAHIIKDGEFTSAEIAKLQQDLGQSDEFGKLKKDKKTRIVQDKKKKK
ncbi:MAG TPA: type IV pilus secretin PilQ [Candidatus Omnitrophota bacterium]|nr:type IV pilus secretin PilQ [Candidatus Omnitrophota bacterium]HPT07957.1 type IV pilus secretin PilQ [Candidatus Omnitrophota bacterium]